MNPLAARLRVLALLLLGIHGVLCLPALLAGPASDDAGLRLLWSPLVRHWGPLAARATLQRARVLDDLLPAGGLLGALAPPGTAAAGLLTGLAQALPGTLRYWPWHCAACLGALSLWLGLLAPLLPLCGLGRQGPPRAPATSAPSGATTAMALPPLLVVATLGWALCPLECLVLAPLWAMAWLWVRASLLRDTGGDSTTYP